jgi:hypothetical protein
LAWDMLLTRETFELMFKDGGSGIPAFLERVSEEEQTVIACGMVVIKEFAIQGRGQELYGLLRLDKLGIKPYVFQKWLNEILYWRHKGPGKIRFADME